VPWWLVHTAVFAWAITRGETARDAGAGQRLGLVATHAWHNFAFAMNSRVGRVIDWGARLVRRGLARIAGFVRSLRPNAEG
jgi:hypothetical protein